jgi:hypothetical protein
MVFRQKIYNPFSNHLWFAWYPVKVFSVEKIGNTFVLETTWVWMERVVRRLDKNLSGTFRWEYFLK